MRKDAVEASQGRRGSHVFTILRVSVIATAFALLVGALASAFWMRKDDARGIVENPDQVTDETAPSE